MWKSSLLVSKCHSGLREGNSCQQTIVRTMRALVAMGICEEYGSYEYLSNEVTREFTSGGFEDGVKCLFVKTELQHIG